MPGLVIWRGKSVAKKTDAVAWLGSKYRGLPGRLGKKKKQMASFVKRKG